ncbi:tyrosine-type recombinase/integrase [Marivirga lumbricoides]
MTALKAPKYIPTSWKNFTDKMEELINYLKKKGCSKSTIESYKAINDIFLQWAASRHLEPCFIKYSELMDYVSHLKKRGISQRTVQSYMIAIAHYFEALHQSDPENYPTNPAGYLNIKSKQAKKLYPNLSREQLEALYTDYDLHLRNTKPTARASAIRNKIAVGLMVYQGLEVTTLSRLNVKDVDVLNGKVSIRRGRNYNERTLALHAGQIIMMDRYINQTRKELQESFGQQDSDLLLITGYQHYREMHIRIVKRLRKQQPLLQNAHQVRASVITLWLKQYNIREVQYMAGHRRIFSTEAYLQNDMEGLKVAVDKFHPLG